jgi:hypothetical protein
MDTPVLNDKNTYPSDEILAKYLRKTKIVFDSLISHVSSIVNKMLDV